MVLGREAANIRELMMFGQKDNSAREIYTSFYTPKTGADGVWELPLVLETVASRCPIWRRSAGETQARRETGFGRVAERLGVGLCVHARLPDHRHPCGFSETSDAHQHDFGRFSGPGLGCALEAVRNLAVRLETVGGAQKTARKVGGDAGRAAAAACDAQKSVDDRRILNEAGKESGTRQRQKS